MKNSVLALLSLLLFGCNQNRFKDITISIQPMDVEKEKLFLLEEIKASILENPEFKVNILPAVSLPKSAWYATNKRYKANKILLYLKKIKPAESDYILALTSKHISVTKGGGKDWGIFGLGYQPGKCAVISTFKLGKGKKLLTRRVLKITKHELGHNFGLPHCTHSKTCVMRAAEGSIKTIDRVSNIYCKNCIDKLNR